MADDVLTLSTNTPENYLQVAIVENTKERLARNISFTRLGATGLICVNGTGVKNSFFSLDDLCSDSTTPHINELIASAYLHMIRSAENQIVLIR